MVETKGAGGLPRCKVVKTASLDGVQWYLTDMDTSRTSAVQCGDTLSVPLSRLIQLTSSELAEFVSFLLAR